MPSFLPTIPFIEGPLRRSSCSPAAKSRSGKDAGSVRSRRLRARLRTRPERALQRPGECEACGRGPSSRLLALLARGALWFRLRLCRSLGLGLRLLLRLLFGLDLRVSLRHLLRLLNGLCLGFGL